MSAAAVGELVDTRGMAGFTRWTLDNDLDVFTINGFPYGDFHQRIVKRDVYQPDWRSPQRLQYTLKLAQVLEAMRPTGSEASISTLPLGWGPWLATDEDVALAAANLRLAAVALARAEDRSGTLIHLDLEPEPGCRLQRAVDVVAFFEQHLLTGADDDLVRRYLRVCHDICHAAVMFEDQAGMLAAYDAIGVRVGKVQVSSAVRARFDHVDAGERRLVLEELGRFREQRYLHQTMVRSAPGDEPVFFDDLPDALASAAPRGEWRTHFHVPIFLERCGRLHTTIDEIETCLDLVRDRSEIRHFEVETYAWEVLPSELKGETLALDIARELRWLGARLAAGERV